MKNMNMKWPCIVTAESTLPSGRRVRMRRVVDGAGDVESAMLRALKSRRDGGYPFLGEKIEAITPLGQKVVRLYDPDTGRLLLI